MDEVKRNAGEIMIQRMTTLLDMNMVKDFTKFNIIGVNVNSLLNVLTHDVLLDEIKKSKDNYDIFMDALTAVLRLFLLNVNGRKIIFYYSMNTERYTELYIKDFRKEQLALYSDKFIKSIFVHLLEILKRLSSTVKGVKLYNTDKVEPSLVMYYLVKKNKEELSLILSRDYMDFLILTESNVSLWDGLTYFEGGDNFKNHTSKKIPPIDCRLLKYYYTLRGIPRLKIFGINKMGEKRAIIYLQKNLQEIINEIDTTVNKDYLTVYDYERYIKIEGIRQKIVNIVGD